MANQQIIDRGWLRPLLTTAFPLLSAIALFEIMIHPQMYGLQERLNVIVSTTRYPEHSEVVVRSHYTGIVSLDYGLRTLVLAFLPGAAPFNEQQQVQMAYFFFSFFPLLAIMNVEATRYGSGGAWIRYTSVWALLYQTSGGAVILPIWFLLFLRHSAQIRLYGSLSMRLPLAYAKAMVPAHMLGYLFPTIMILLPINGPGLSTKQALIAGWQPCPIYVNILAVVIAQVLSKSNEITEVPGNDVRYVKALYGCSFVVGIVSHVALVYRWTQSRWSLSDILVPRTSSLQGSVPNAMLYIFQVDFAIIFAVALLTAWVVVADLRSLQRSNLTSMATAISLILHTVLIGPGATLAALWWWRENQLRSDERNGKSSKEL